MEDLRVPQDLCLVTFERIFKPPLLDMSSSWHLILGFLLLVKTIKTQQRERCGGDKGDLGTESLTAKLVTRDDLVLVRAGGMG